MSLHLLLLAWGHWRHYNTTQLCTLYHVLHWECSCWSQDQHHHSIFRWMHLPELKCDCQTAFCTWWLELRPSSFRSFWKKAIHGWRWIQSIQPDQIYWPADYSEVISSARQPNPYMVKNLHFSFFWDFSKIVYYRSICIGEPQVVDIRDLLYSPDVVIQWKLHHSDTWTPLPHRPNKLSPFSSIPM